MKVKQVFNPNLLYQLSAINSIIDIFNNVEFSYSTGDTNKKINPNLFSFFSKSISTANPKINKDLWNDVILKNVKNIQINNHLEEVQYIDEYQPVFDIEMETGTGKTYVYLRTILELNRKYGYKKFIILVPNKAVKETIQSHLKSYTSHFSDLYSETNYNYKYYDSKSLDIVWNFSESTNLEILIMNIQQINKMDENDKNSNNIYKKQDYLLGSTALDLIKETNPILIIDEPQSTASGIKSIKAIKELNPTFILRYSATFRKRNNEILMYKLDAIDAYNLNLVKRIDALCCDDNSSNDIVIKKFDAKSLSADVELVTLTNKLDLKFKKYKVFKGSNLYDLTNNSKYKNLIVEEINFVDRKIIFTNGRVINYGVTYDINTKALQISSTIKKHLDQQLKLLDKDIKVLSLFFIDKVSNYRQYDENRNPILGPYGKIFEDTLRELLSDPKYQKLLGNRSIDDYISKCHNGYFSIDPKGHFIDSSKNGDSLVDQSAYEKIMRDKENLLSFDEPLSFIFSHTALKEGWDNPNVFQICTLNETTSVTKMHQEIGRGLRLCLDQSGNRIVDEDLNHLTVVVNFSYKEFVDTLQSEMKDNGVNFGELNINSFVFKDPKDNTKQITYEQSKKLFNSLIRINVIDSKTKKLNIVYTNNFDILKRKLLNEVSWDSEELCILVVNKLLMSANRNYKIGNAKNRVDNKLNKEVLFSEEFLELWNKISRKSQYLISFNEDEFVNNVINSFIDEVDTKLSGNKIITTLASIGIDETGVFASKVNIQNTHEYEWKNFNKKILTIVNDIEIETNLRRKTIVRILSNDSVLNILKNPSDKILEFLLKIIKQEKRKQIYDNIRYEPMDEFYNIEQFADSLPIYMDESSTYQVVNKSKYPYDYIETDSKIEFSFAKSFDDNDLIKKFIKLPAWYKIKTPDNTYNPDWSFISRDKQDRVYIYETKGSNNSDDLRITELRKTKCARLHFKAISNDIEYKVVDNFIKSFK